MSEQSQNKKRESEENEIEKVDATEVKAQESETAASAENDEASHEAAEEEAVAREREAQETYERLLRVSAEFENYKKRTAREMSEFRKFANESLIKEMLPIVDDLERAIHSSSSDEAANSCIIEGVDLTLKAIEKVFDKYGVTPIESLGKAFDPSFHQAVMQEESEACDENTVIKELHKGYLMHERLLRPSMVVVSIAKAAKAAPADQDSQSKSEPA